MKKQVKKITLLFLCLFYVDTAFSQSNLKSGYDCQWRIPAYSCCMRANFYTDLSLGAAFSSHFGSEEYIIYRPETPDKQIIFNIKSADKEKFLPQNFAIGFGYFWLPTCNSANFFPGISIGLSYQKTNFKKESTAMYFDIKDILNERNILFKFKPTFYQDTLFTNVKINLMRFYSVMPYLKTGVGLSWNTMSPETVESQLSDDNMVQFWMPISRQVSLAFQMGLGLDFLVNKNLIVNFGYTYTYLGPLQSAKPQSFIYKGNELEEQDTNEVNRLIKAFHFGSLTTHNLEISLRYLFA